MRGLTPPSRRTQSEGVLKEPPAAASGTPEAPQAIPAHTLTTRPSPFVAIPRRISFVQGRRWRERACTFALFSLAPTVFFWLYFSFSIWPRITPAYSGLRIAAPVTSLWITFAPLLMQQGEFNLERLIQAFNDDGPDTGWPRDDIQRAIDTAARVYYWITLPLAAVAGATILAAYPTLAGAIPLNSYSRAGGVFDLAVTGFTSASGLWGVYTALTVIKGATGHAAITWRPFRSARLQGVTRLYSFTWSTAIIFSAGSVFLPSLIVLRQRLGAIPSAIVLIFTALLFIGGLLIFSLPAVMLYNMAQDQQARTLDKLAPMIEQHISRLEQADQQTPANLIKTHYTLSAALQARAAIAALQPAPVFNTIARAATTLVLPLLLTLLQLAPTVIK